MLQKAHRYFIAPWGLNKIKSKGKGNMVTQMLAFN